MSFYLLGISISNEHEWFVDITLHIFIIRIMLWVTYTTIWTFNLPWIPLAILTQALLNFEVWAISEGLKFSPSHYKVLDLISRSCLNMICHPFPVISKHSYSFKDFLFIGDFPVQKYSIVLDLMLHEGLLTRLALCNIPGPNELR